MDLIEVARIVLRRWYVALGVLLVGGIATVVVASSIEVQYRVDAESILISGQVATTADGAENPINPYQAFSGSLYTTLSAVTRTVDGREYRERLGADGTVRDFEFSTSQEAPVILTQSLAGSPEDATSLSGEVQLALAETLNTLQNAENVPQEQQIVLRVLTTAAPQQETGSRTRVLIGGLGLTLAAAVGLAVLVEALVRARRQRAAGSLEFANEDGASNGAEGGQSGGKGRQSGGSRQAELPAEGSREASGGAAAGDQVERPVGSPSVDA